MKSIRFEVEGVKEPYGWSGTITSEPFLGMAMYWHQPVIKDKGDALYFLEIWLIKDVDENIILSGYDEGETRLQNGTFTGNGKVIYAAEGWKHLIGLKEQCEGKANLEAMTFTGNIQIN